MAIFIDEGGFSRSRRAALPDCTWDAWGTYGVPELDVWVHGFGPIGPARGEGGGQTTGATT